MNLRRDRQFFAGLCLVIWDFMYIKVNLGRIIIGIYTEHEIIIDESFCNFLCSDEADLNISVSWEWNSLPLPNTPMLGEDLLHRYYVEDDVCFCMTKSGVRGEIANCMYTPDFRQISCAVNFAAYPYVPHTLSWILRALPMCAIFQHFGVIFLHSSQIALEGLGICFAAPSGTGKTTQANFWVRERNAQLICGDRTLLRWVNGQWLTYGYPIDGSHPVRSNTVNRLGALVVLSQAAKNSVHRKTASGAAVSLMPQIVFDSWSPAAESRAVELLLELAQAIPVYHLGCTPDLRAVTCLERQLVSDGILSAIRSRKSGDGVKNGKD